MPINKVVKRDFTVVQNTMLRDKQLGISERGLLLTMLSLPDNWEFSIKGLSQILPDGVTKISTALKNLEILGYLKRRRIYENGKIKDWEYLFSDEPDYLKQEIQDSENLDSENLNQVKQDKENLSYNKINNNQINKNQILSNQSVNQSAMKKTSAGKTETDGQIDRQKKSMTFSEVLEEIGFDKDRIDFVPENEQELQEFDEEDRELSVCSIPYSLKADKKAMKEALKFLFAYSHYAPTMPDQDKRLLDTVISVLTEMTGKDIQEYQGQRVRYSDVIDRLNEVIYGSDGSLFDWFNSFEQQWNKILAENDIRHQKAYMKSCIWNWLNDYAFEDDNSIRELEYKFRQGVI